MRPVVYLHGFASGPTSSKARFFKQRLEAAGIPVTVPDLAAGDFPHLTITGQLRVLQQAAGAGPVSLMGSSMGGYLAALYAARHPEVERLVLMAPGFRFATRWPELQGAEAMEQWRRTGSMEVFHYAENRPMQLSTDIITDSEQYEGEPAFQQPALIFHGIHDDVVPIEYSRQFAAGRKNVQLFEMDAGHDLLNMLEPIAAKTLDWFQ
ncbi:MAG TPA: YqiA/YcfP family alpha/beta fold hydrolase [Candidatus Limnocylindrales bacterium]|nr:YqiA/YcfP family alpha/beta fold hydrolase [Candidatus Limnocylindrales bacterium]